MIPLDANLVREPLRSVLEPRAAGLLDEQVDKSLNLSAYTATVLRSGSGRYWSVAAPIDLTSIWSGRCCQCSLEDFGHSICWHRELMRN